MDVLSGLLGLSCLALVGMIGLCVVCIVLAIRFLANRGGRPRPPVYLIQQPPAYAPPDVPWAPPPPPDPQADALAQLHRHDA